MSATDNAPPKPGDVSQAESVSLGEIAIDRDAFELDLKINEGYQSYSAEILRLSLLALTGLSFVWLKLYLPDKDSAFRDVSSFGVYGSLGAAFLAFVLSSGAALLHRNTASESLAYHLTTLRRYKRRRPARSDRPSDLELAARDTAKRDWFFKLSGLLLSASAVLLVIGVLAFGVAMFCVMRSPIASH
jgi:hypothetical protein